MHEERRRRGARWVGGLLGALLLAGLALGAPRWGGAEEPAGDPGFLLGCPGPPPAAGEVAPSLAVKAVELAGAGAVVDWVRADGSTGQKTFPLDELLLAVLLKSPKPFDTDGDGAADMALTVTGGLLLPGLEGVTGTLLQEVVEEFKAELSPWNLGWVSGFKWLRVEIRRLPGAEATGVVDAAAGLDLEMTLADGSVVVKPVRVGLRKADPVPAAGFAFPDTFGLALHWASPVDASDVTMLRADVDYAGVAEADQPATETYLTSGSDLDFRLGWSGHTPKEFAFGDMQRCFPNLGDWGTQPEQPYNYLVLARSANGPSAPTAHLDVVSDAGQGADGADGLAVHATVEKMPAMLDAMLKKDLVRFHRRVVKDEDTGLPVADVPPEMSFAYSSATAGEEPAHLELATKALTEWAVLKMTDLPDGTTGSVDVRFCNGSGGEDLCVDSTGGPADARFRYQNYLPPGEGAADPLPGLPTAERYVAYDSLQPDADPLSERYRVAGRLSRPEQVTFAEEPGAAPAGAFKVTARTAEGALNDDVAVHVDVDDTAAPGGDRLVVDGVADELPKTLEASYATDPAAGKSLGLGYSASAQTGLSAKVVQTTPTSLLTQDVTTADVSFAAADGGAPTAFTLHMKEPPAAPAHRVEWTADGPATLTIGEIAFTDKGPAGVTSGTRLTGRVTGLPTQATVDFAGVGGAAVALDTRFCVGDWGTPGCDPATVGSAEKVEVVAENTGFPAPADFPALPEDGRWVSYSSEQQGAEKRWRAGASLSGVRRFALDSAASSPFVPSDTIVALLSAPGANTNVGLAVDVRSDTRTLIDGVVAELPDEISSLRLTDVESAGVSLVMVDYAASAGMTVDAAIAQQTPGPGGHDTKGTLHLVSPAEFTAVLLTRAGSPDTTLLWNAGGVTPELRLSLVRDGDPGADPLGLDVRVLDMPEHFLIDAVFWGDGTFRTLDARSCADTWGSDFCQATLGQAGSVEVVARNHPGEPDPFPAGLPAGDTPWVVYDAAPAPGAGAEDMRWRAGGRLRAVEHLAVRDASDLTDFMGMDSVVTATFRADTLPGANTAMVVRVDDDTTHTVAGAEPGTTAGSRLHVDGEIAVLPAFLELKALWFDRQTSPAQEDNGSKFYLDASTSEEVTLDAAVSSVLPDGTKEVDGRVVVSPKAPVGALPTDWHLVWGRGTFCDDVDFDWQWNTPEIKARRGCAEWTANKEMHVDGGVVYLPDPERPDWYQLHTASDLPTSFDLHWRTDGTYLRHVAADAACEDPPSRVGAGGNARSGGGSGGDGRSRTTGDRVCNDVDVTVRRLPYGPVGADLLTPPALPVPDGPPEAAFPAFTPAPHSVTVGLESDSDWGGRVHVGDLTKVRYTRTPTSGDDGVTDLCVQAEATEEPLALGFFHAKAKSLSKPVYVDGVLSERPMTVGLRLDPATGPNDPAGSPLAWLSLATCDLNPGANLPDPVQPPTAGSGVTADVRVRVGDAAIVGGLVASDPADRSPGRPKGIDAHVQIPAGTGPSALAGGAKDAWGVDATALVDVPDHLVVYPVAVSTCDAEMPIWDYVACHKGEIYEPEDTLQASLKVVSTLASFGRLSVQVRVKDPGTSPPTITEAGIASLPGSFQGAFALRDVHRVNVTDVEASFGGLGPAAPDLDDFEIVRWDPEEPAYKFEVPDEAHHVPNIRVHVDDIGPKLAVKASLYRPVPPNNFTKKMKYPVDDCTASFRPGDPGLGYLHATVDAHGDGDDLGLTGNFYPDGRSGLQVTSGGDNTIDATIDAKVVRVHQSQPFTSTDVTPWWLDPFDWFPDIEGDFEFCMDADIPIRLEAQDARRLRLAGDGIEYTLARNKGAGKTSLRVEERFGDEVRGGAFFARHKVVYDPPDVVTYETNYYAADYTGQRKDLHPVRQSSLVDTDDGWLGVDGTFEDHNVWVYWWWCPDDNGGQWPAWGENAQCPQPNVVEVADNPVYLDTEPYEDYNWAGFLLGQKDLFTDPAEKWEGSRFVLDVFFDKGILGNLRERDEDYKLVGRPGEEFWNAMQNQGSPLGFDENFRRPGLAPGTKVKAKASGNRGFDCKTENYAPKPDMSVTTSDGTVVTLESATACSTSGGWGGFWSSGGGDADETRSVRHRLVARHPDGSTRYLVGRTGPPSGSYLSGYGPDWLTSTSVTQKAAAWKSQWVFFAPLVARELQVLPEGTVQVAFQKVTVLDLLLQVFLKKPVNKPKAVFVFDPSGNGGPVAPKPVTWSHDGGSSDLVATTSPPGALGPYTTKAGTAVTLSQPAGLLGCVPGADCTLRWYFGDGDSAEGFQASHTYHLPGKYPAVAVVFDAKGNVRGVRRVDVTVTDPPPKLPG